MNIKNKLTVRFILVFGGCWGLASYIVYYASSEFRQEEFYERLESRAKIAARLLLEVEEVDAQLLRKIENANPIKLPGEKILIYDYQNVELFSTDTQDSIEVGNSLLDKIRLSGQVQWRQGEVEVLGILYTEKYDRVVVITGAQDLYGYRKLEYLRNVLLLVFLLAVLISAPIARVYAGRALKPISEVVRQVKVIGENNLHDRVSEGNGKDEVAVLGITFNQLLGRLHQAFESRKAFISNASHELRTPLTSIRSQLDTTLMRKRSVEVYKKTLLSIREDITELSDLVTKLLLLTRIESFKEALVPLRLDAIMWPSITEVSRRFKNPIQVEMDGGINDENELMVLGNEPLLRSVWVNILENACKYSNGSEVSIRLWNQGQKVCFSIMDKGIGISEQDLENLGLPFFRGQNAHSTMGSGIGLSLVNKVIELHCGVISFSSKVHQGTTVSVNFPIV